MGLCADRLRGGSAVSDYVLGWLGDPRRQSDNVPLRLAGARHAWRIEGLALEGVYPSQEGEDEALWAAVEPTLLRFPKRIVLSLQSAPQTNEVLRAAVILPALALIEEHFGRPLDLFELGASGGLNLYADQFHRQIPGAAIGNPDATVRLHPDGSGPLPPTRLQTVVSRRAVDLNPLDPTDPTDQLRLLAYLWPDQPDRMSHTRAAIGIAKVDPPKIDCGDARDWLAEVLEAPAKTGRGVYHTVAWQYFTSETRAKVREATEKTGSCATDEAPFAQLSMEAEGGVGAAVKLEMWPGGASRQIAHGDFHGRWVNWTGV